MWYYGEYPSLVPDPLQALFADRDIAGVLSLFHYRDECSPNSEHAHGTQLFDRLPLAEGLEHRVPSFVIGRLCAMWDSSRSVLQRQQDKRLDA